MRHFRSGRKLGRTRSHRRATLSALSISLIQHKRIQTTTAKAKEARMVVEKLITRAKRAVLKEGDGKAKDVHARRQVFAFLRDREAVSTLFNDIAQKVLSRPGGYTRVVKLGQRRGDGAEVALIELVDYNTGQEKTSAKPDDKDKKEKAQAAKKKERVARRETAARAADSKGETEGKPEKGPATQDKKSRTKKPKGSK